MSKNLFFIFLFVVQFFGVKAQVAGTEEINADTVYKKVLLIPYPPMMHLSDADQHIAEFMGTTNERIRSEFRYGITRNVNMQLMKNYPTYSLLAIPSEENEKTLDMIYGSINYRMDTVFPVSHPVKDSAQKKSIFSKSKTSKVKEIHDLMFMNATLSHPALLTHLAEKYSTDLFVFLNQFEIITNYDDCLDLALKIYRRQIKVHYSVYELHGKELYGDVAVVDFPSNSNDTREIMLKNFYTLTDYMEKTIPTKKVQATAELSETTEIRK